MNVAKTVRMEDVELELSDETVEALELYGYKPKEAIGEHLRTKIRKNVARLRRNKCPKCGKPTKRTLIRSQVRAVNEGVKTLEELGVCTCDG